MRLAFNTLTATAALLVAGSVGAVGIPGQGTWETTLLPRDINGDSVVDAYYDTVLGISWRADAGGAGSSTWSDAAALAAGLNLYGVTGWRLPSTVDADSSYAIPVIGAPPASSEMAHLYYVTLGNAYSVAAPPNTGSFANLVTNNGGSTYWSGTEDGGGYYWYFVMSSGHQNSNFGAAGAAISWAVHDGDVLPSPVPEPKIYALMLAGLSVMALSRRLKRSHRAARREGLFEQL